MLIEAEFHARLWVGAGDCGLEELYAIRSEHPFGDFFEEGMLDQIQQGLGEKVAARAISIPWFAEREVITDGG